MTGVSLVPRGQVEESTLCKVPWLALRHRHHFLSSYTSYCENILGPHARWAQYIQYIYGYCNDLWIYSNIKLLYIDINNSWNTAGSQTERTTPTQVGADGKLTKHRTILLPFQQSKEFMCICVWAWLKLWCVFQYSNYWNLFFFSFRGVTGFKRFSEQPMGLALSFTKDGWFFFIHLPSINIIPEANVISVHAFTCT